jgi:alpha-D-ribose 1-methylphosphonate 5-triphosphate synthase subunit PhnH
MTAAPLQSGFADSVRESQAVFRAVMMALARPGSLQPLVPSLAPPKPLTAELAAVALALTDHEAALWLDTPLAASGAAAEFLKFHTGARQVADPSVAAFALVSDPRTMPSLADFAQGTDEYPDRSTTLVIAVDGIAANGPLTLEGPGIKGSARLALSPLPADFIADRADNHLLFPRGVDCVFVVPGVVAALPRTTVVGEH